MKKSVVINTLREYFSSKGKALTYEEYRDSEDAPIRIQLVKRTLGTWNRVLNAVGPIEPIVEVPKETIKNETKKSPTK